MATFIRELPLLVCPKECLKVYLDDFNFFHMECFKATLSKTLGLAIISGSVLVKLPQILKIFQNKSAQGINIISILLELFAITATAAYSFVNGFPFSSWGEAVFLALQTVTIACLVFYYCNGLTKTTTFVFAYLSIIIAIGTGLTPIKVLWFAQTLNIPIILLSKIIQGYTNYSNASTGQLSAVTIFMLFFGSLARIFTSIQETGDKTIIIMYVCSTIANGIIVSQLLYYWNVSERKVVKSKKLK
ncbi:PREDICTED: mannose-P-dolichol utilization defect 1 protein homolog [Ceratosolen solmsi marchali]|uniref:Mannose-P-dolichol utilization defect 1 protein homolog n=1 Tax=Ceratosolen solmsi marchali TaxID=326594 RepID=A0AAJ7DZ26_9HYME|nr:PREDICTED: mannose-P-dolichol utilization defect 1 protein homolog [Ceratosolen solmsi marchali]